MVQQTEQSRGHRILGIHQGLEAVSEKLVLTPHLLQAYLEIESEQSIRSADEFTKEVLDYYILGEEKQGIKLPWPKLENTFRLRNGECTIIAGINSSGKSLVVGQITLSAMAQKATVLSVSLEMPPRSQLIRMWRQASLSATPDLDFGIEFNSWSRGKLYFFDKEGSIDMNTLEAGIRYAIAHYGVNLITVDSLMTISGIRNDDYTAQKEVVCRLADLSRDLDCHILLVAHARKSMSVKDKIDRFSIRGAGELTDRVDNVILLQRYYSDDELDADCWLAISKARHWDTGECEIDLWLDLASLNVLTEGQKPAKLVMYGQELEEV